MLFHRTFLLVLLILVAYQCSQPLPILSKSGTEAGTYQTIPTFRFINQDSQIVTNDTFAEKAYVTDFFFTSCPTICPIMTREMHRIYKRFEQDDRLLLLSHSIDTRRDSVARLRQYAEGLEVKSSKWYFVTGEKDAIFDIADDYFNIVVEDETLPGGYDHSGRFVLVDKNGLIRSYCNGTDPKAVNQFMQQIQQLLDEEY